MFGPACAGSRLIFERPLELRIGVHPHLGSVAGQPGSAAWIRGAAAWNRLDPLGSTPGPRRPRLAGAPRRRKQLSADQRLASKVHRQGLTHQALGGGQRIGLLPIGAGHGQQPRPGQGAIIARWDRVQPLIGAPGVAAVRYGRRLLLHALEAWISD